MFVLSHDGIRMNLVRHCWFYQGLAMRNPIHRGNFFCVSSLLLLTFLYHCSISLPVFITFGQFGRFSEVWRNQEIQDGGGSNMAGCKELMTKFSRHETASSHLADIKRNNFGHTIYLPGFTVWLNRVKLHP